MFDDKDLEKDLEESKDANPFLGFGRIRLQTRLIPSIYIPRCTAYYRCNIGSIRVPRFLCPMIRGGCRCV